MKKINELEVSVNYRVCLSDIEVPDDVYEQLTNHYFFGFDTLENLHAATSWLFNNIKEYDALDIDYDIIDIYEEEN